MPCCVEMDVQVPRDLDPAVFDRLKAEEGPRRHLWRVAGRYADVSIFDVASHDELHAILSTLPLFPFVQMKVTPLAQHPSAIAQQ